MTVATKHRKGTTVAWTMADGHLMAGEVIHCRKGLYQIRRVDGTICQMDPLAAEKLRLRSGGSLDVERAWRFFLRNV